MSAYPNLTIKLHASISLAMYSGYKFRLIPALGGGVEDDPTLYSFPHPTSPPNTSTTNTLHTLLSTNII